MLLQHQPHQRTSRCVSSDSNKIPIPPENKPLRLLGLEQNSDSGLFGTSSAGTTRIWRLSHEEEHFQHKMIESLKLWRELEQISGEKLVYETGMLDFGPKSSPSLQKCYAVRIFFEISIYLFGGRNNSVRGQGDVC